MAYDEGIAQRIRGVLGDCEDVEEKKMFGGIAFMMAGHMCVGVIDDRLMARGSVPTSMKRRWLACTPVKWISPADP